MIRKGEEVASKWKTIFSAPARGEAMQLLLRLSDHQVRFPAQLRAHRDEITAGDAAGGHEPAVHDVHLHEVREGLSLAHHLGQRLGSSVRMAGTTRQCLFIAASFQRQE